MPSHARYVSQVLQGQGETMRILDIIRLPFAVAGAFVGALGLPGCWDAIKGCLAEARAMPKAHPGV